MPKLTAPGPETLLQVLVRDPGGLGKPSSAAEPSKLALAGRVIVWSAPAFTVGGWLTVTVIAVEVELVAPALSVTVKLAV